MFNERTALSGRLVKSLRLSMPGGAEACQLLAQMCPQTFDDIQILIAWRIIHDWVEMIAAKSFKGLFRPQTLLVVLYKLNIVWQSAFAALAQPTLGM